jgi:nitrous oxide reductase accessory protein NosL
MGLFDEVFGGQEKEYQVVESLFPSEEEVTKDIVKSQKYKLSLAERYANHVGTTVEEALSFVEIDKQQELLSTNTDFSYTPVMNKAYAEGASPEEFKMSMDVYKRNTDYLLSSGDSKDVLEDIIIDKFDPNTDNLSISLAVLREEFEAAAPDESILGLASSFLGTIARESTVGVAENLLGATGTSMSDWKGKSQIGNEKFQAIMEEPSLERKKLLARQMALEAKDIGVFGDNTLNYWSRFATIASAGKGEAEAIWLGVDLLGLLPVGKVLGVTGKAAKTSGTAAKLTLATDALEVAEATGGKVAANRVLDTALSNPATSINTAKHTAPSSSSVASNGLGPTMKPTLMNEVANDYAETLRNAYKGMYSEDMIQAAKSRKKVQLEKSTKYHVLDIAEKDIGFDNYTVEITMGKDNGLPFTDIDNATKFAKNLGGRVEPYGVNSAGTAPEGFVVKLDRNLNMKGLASATELGKLRSSMFDIFASPEITSSKDLNTVLKRGLDKIGFVENEIINQHKALFKKISKDDARGIDQVISKLNTEDPLDGDWYDISTFKDKFYNQTGRSASKEVIDGYVSSYKLAETARWLEADRILKRSTGEKLDQFVGSADGKTFYRMKRLPAGALPRLEEYAQKYVYDLNTGKIIDRKSFMKGGKNKNLYQIVDVDNAPEVNGKKVLYATGSLKTSRPLFPSDVVPRTAGGTRQTGNIHGFLVSQRKTVDLSDNAVNLTPTVFGVGRTAQELVKMGTEVNTLLKGLRDFDAGTISKEIMNGLIKASNNFNPSIEDVDGLKAFIDKHGINAAEDIQIVTKDMPLPEVGVARFENYRLGKLTTYDELYSRGSRQNAMIYGYDNKSFKQVDAVRGIERDFAKGTNYIAEREYSVKAVEGFLNSAIQNKLILNYEDIKKKPFIQQLKEAQLANSEAGNKLKTERRVILNRLSESNEFSQAWNRRMTGIGEWIFDAKLTKGLDIIDKMNIRPDVALRSFAFDMKLGLFNPDQFVVQASSALNIMAIAPMDGLKAAASYLPLRMAMINPDPNVLKALYKRSSTFIGMTEGEFLESIDYMRRSGRFQVNQNISEINGTYDVTRGMINKVRELGRTPFNEGERVQRLMATNVAYREFRKANPFLDVNTDAGFRIMDDFITNRTDNLTMNMTRSSAAWWQQGFMSLPTQWLGYQAKLMENIFFSRNLTGAERTRLGLAQVALFGGAGIPLGGLAVNAFVDQGTEGIDKDAYTVLRYGLIDYTLSNIINEDTAMSGRLGVGDGLLQVYEDFMDKNFAELIGGPSLSIATDTGSSAITLVGSLFNSDISLTQYDASKVLRNISTLDKLAKGYYLMQTGEFIDKKGRTLAEGMSPWNALWNTLGTPFQEVELYYDVRQALYSESQMVKGVTDRTRELVRLQNDYIMQDDMASATGIRDEILSLLAPLSPDQRRSVINLSRESFRTLAKTSIMQDAKTANQGLSIQLQKLISKEGQ